ncbi:hypothetical protein ES703_122348 [subsurface metagenome]
MNEEENGSGGQEVTAQKQITIIKRVRSKDYRDIFVWGVYGGERLDYFEVVIQSYGVNAAESQDDENQDQNRVVGEVKDEISLKMTPRIAKIIHNWLGEHVKSWEEVYGKIDV